MSLQPPFFGKRPETPATNNNSNTTRPGGLSSASHGSSIGSMGAASAQPATPAVTPPAVVAPVAASTALTSGAPTKEGGSQLTVGPNIKLKGVEITDCDTLVVEGTVEATMDSRVMHITEIGAFKGSADIDFAEIHGEFNGDLTVRQKLVIYSTGRVTGKIRYGKVVIQEGGQLMGDIQFGAVDTKILSTPKTVGLMSAVA
jgi:cytoskeletal protein CcmA (bactofilin family)